MGCFELDQKTSLVGRNYIMTSGHFSLYLNWQYGKPNNKPSQPRNLSRSILLHLSALGMVWECMGWFIIRFAMVCHIFNGELHLIGIAPHTSHSLSPLTHVGREPGTPRQRRCFQLDSMGSPHPKWHHPYRRSSETGEKHAQLNRYI